MSDFEVVGETLNNVLHAAVQQTPDEEMLDFGKLKTDKDRMAFVLKKDKLHEMTVFEAETTKKGAEQACKFREEGNKSFGKKSYMTAVDCYNKSIRHAPWDMVKMKGSDESGQNELVLSLGNRSAALLHLRKFELCLRDIDYAFQFGYPEEMAYKLFDRKGKVYTQMRQPEKAIKNFMRAEQMLKTSQLDDKGKETWKASIAKQLKICDKIIADNSKKDDKKEVPKVEGGRNSTHAQVSDHVTFQHSNKDEVGRYAMATQNIRVGTVLGEEKPFVSVLLPEFFPSHCYHCHVRVFAPLPDVKWTNIGYCSPQCIQQAWDSYHSVEYPFQSLLMKEWCGKVGHLALRIAIVMGYTKMKDYLTSTAAQQEDDPLKRGFTQEGRYSDGYHAFFNMETNIKKRLPEGLFDFAVYSMYLLKLLQAAGFFAGEKDAKIDIDTRYNEELIMIGGGLLKHLQVLQCNAIGIAELQTPSDFENAEPAYVAMAVYPTMALLNHSCDPNADLNFYGDHVILRATRNIAKGEKINIDYGVVFYKNVKAQRKGTLSGRYCFNCECHACVDEWHLFRDLEAEMPLFCCDSCGRALPMGGKLVEDKYLRCENKRCNNLQNLQEGVGQLGVSHDLFSGAMENAVHGHLKEALPNLESHLQLMQKILLPPWRDLVTCQAAVRQIYRMFANIYE